MHLLKNQIYGNILYRNLGLIKVKKKKKQNQWSKAKKSDLNNNKKKKFFFLIISKFIRKSKSLFCKGTKKNQEFIKKLLIFLFIRFTFYFSNKIIEHFFTTFLFCIVYKISFAVVDVLLFFFFLAKNIMLVFIIPR